MKLDELKEIIDTQVGVLLYFSGENCNVCHALRPKFAKVFEENFPQLQQVYLDAHKYPDISAHFQVFSVPTMIVYMDGREFAREGRNVSLHQLTKKLIRPYNMMVEA